MGHRTRVPSSRVFAQAAVNGNLRKRAGMCLSGSMSMTESKDWGSTFGAMGQCSKGTSKMTKSKIFS